MLSDREEPRVPRARPPSTVGRAKPIRLPSAPGIQRWSDRGVEVRFGDSRHFYPAWDAPDVIVSDGAYGVLGFEGDTSDHLGIPEWYEPHVAGWAQRAKPGTTLWFWNSEIGWAAAHPVLERHGFRYVNANIWNKGKAHIAGNVNTAKIRRFPVVTEVCVQYVGAIHLNQKPLGLMTAIVEASSDPGDVVWEPFGGLFSATAAAMKLGRRAFGGEIDPTYFQFGVARLARDARPACRAPATAP